MLCLRRTALRVLSSSPSVSISTPAGKARSITRLTYPIPTKKILQTGFLPFQRRYYADEPATQSEPEADDAIEEADKGAAASEVESADEDATEHASSAADSVKAAAQTAGEAVTGAAQSLGSAAGFGSQGAETNSFGAGGKTSKTVYVGNLFFDVKREDLAKEFSQAGPVTEAKIITDVRGLSKGFGYITFETEEAAGRAIELFNLQNFEGRRLSVQYSLTTRESAPLRQPSGDGRQPLGDGRPLNAPTKTLFIGNMSFDMSDRDLNNLFREIKNVLDVRVAIDRRTGQPRGFAHADFTDVPSAEKAMEELSGKVVCGRALRIDFSTSTGRSAVPSS